MLAVLGGCKSSHQLGQVLDLREGGERSTEYRFTGTRHIDSVDVRTLKTDVWKVEHYTFPDSIRLFVRVLDTTGYVVTHMAAPYKKPSAPDYFPKLVERVGTTPKREKVFDVSPFTVREFGEQDSIPTSIAIALDQSGSMKGVKDVLDYATEKFVQMKRPCDLVSLTGFHKDVKRVFALTADTAAALTEFRDYRKNSQGLFSKVYDGIMSSLQTLQDVPLDQPKVCVVFADGEENTSRAKAADIYEYATKHNISIYCVGFAYANAEELQSLSLYTGGKYYRAYTKADLVAIFMDIYRSLQNYYLVTYVPPDKPTLHHVDVSVVVPGGDTLLAQGMYDKSDLATFTEVGDEFTKYILFAYKSAEIDSSSFPTLDQMAADLERLDRVVLEVQGHTDNVGGEEYNQKLSLERANAVRDALVQRGVAENRLRTKGFAFFVPVASNDTEEGRAKNRRTVFRVLRK
jgi:outer membrane protein OmpA-like peptidoglycan-associated protein